jgi:hypothetical protein
LPRTCLPAIRQAGNNGMSKIPLLAGVEYWNVDPKRSYSFISFLVKNNFANKSLIIPIFQLRGEAELSSK